MDIWDDFELFNDPDADDDLIEHVNYERAYNVRARIDHYNHWNDSEFFNRFRLSKATVTLILNEINENLRNRTERYAFHS